MMFRKSLLYLTTDSVVQIVVITFIMCNGNMTCVCGRTQPYDCLHEYIKITYMLKSSFTVK